MWLDWAGYPGADLLFGSLKRSFGKRGDVENTDAFLSWLKLPDLEGLTVCQHKDRRPDIRSIRLALRLPRWERFAWLLCFHDEKRCIPVFQGTGEANIVRFRPATDAPLLKLYRVFWSDIVVLVPERPQQWLDEANFNVSFTRQNFGWQLISKICRTSRS